jgi:glycosyltransferase involved in cell wall biosynthesis
VDDLASALKRLIADKELRRKLAVNGAETVKNYDIRAVAPKMSQIYQSILEK